MGKIKPPPPKPKPAPPAAPEPADDGPVLNARHQRAIEALLTEPTVSQAAEKAGLARQWVSRQLEQNSTFRSAYRAARQQALQHGIDLVTRYTPLAVQTLAKIANDERAPYASRVQAAAQLLSFGRQVNQAETAALEGERKEMEYTRMTVKEGEATVERVIMLAEEFGRVKDLPPNLQEYAAELKAERAKNSGTRPTK